MNILIPHSWLLDHLETDASPSEIAEYLSLAGPSVEQVTEVDGDFVYDIEVTTNRVDAMSVRGIAREAAVILKQFGKQAMLKPAPLEKPTPSQPILSLPHIVNNPSLCGRVICIALANVNQTPTPEWMAKRLQLIEANVHNSAIDITNYVTHDLGHPCHAFDYDKLMGKGGEIRIVEATAGETFSTLDGLEFITIGGEVVFKNGRGEIIDLPSIKGTANTSVDDNTKTILLLLESIKADKVRYASMTHGIRTVAAQLMEKHVDPHLAQDVLYSATHLYQELCGAQVASEIHDEFPADHQLEPVIFPLATIERYLGLSIPTETVTTILTGLGCQITETNDQSLTIQPPSYRHDLITPADIVEEIARIYGYQNIPSAIMESPLPLNAPSQKTFDVEWRVKSFLSDIGWQEIFSYSMVSEAIAQTSGYSLDDHVKIQNPLSDDRVYLRRSVVPSLVEALENNPLRTDLSVFETAHVYTPMENSLPQETLVLGLASRQSYRMVRGAVEALFAKLFIPSDAIRVVVAESTALTAVFEYQAEGTTIMLGTISVLENGIVTVELDFGSLVDLTQSHPMYQPIPKTTPIIEDLTFTLPSKTPVGSVIATMRATAPEVSRVELKDQYQNNSTFTIWYFDSETNMSAQRVEPIRQQLVAAVEKQWQATLVGSI